MTDHLEEARRVIADVNNDLIDVTKKAAVAPLLWGCLNALAAIAERLPAPETPLCSRPDGCNCNYGPDTEGPHEFCPQHGRSYEDLVEIIEHWRGWTYKYRGEDCYFELPFNWKRSVDQFIDAGLEMDDLRELVDVAIGTPGTDAWRYFCGCCWRRIRDSQEQAKGIAASLMNQEAQGG